MNTEQLISLIAECEHPKLEFKRGWYSGNDQMDEKAWGEFIKDIIGLANGHIGYVGQTGYLIIGVDDQEPAKNERRQLFDVPQTGMLVQTQKLREITLQKLKSTCSPSFPDLRFNFVAVPGDFQLLVIEIPSPPGLLKLDRDLNTRSISFRKGTVFIRVGQEINVADPVEIAALNNAYIAYLKPKDSDDSKSQPVSFKVRSAQNIINQGNGTIKIDQRKKVVQNIHTTIKALTPKQKRDSKIEALLADEMRRFVTWSFLPTIALCLLQILLIIVSILLFGAGDAPLFILTIAIPTILASAVWAIVTPCLRRVADFNKLAKQERSNILTALKQRFEGTSLRLYYTRICIDLILDFDKRNN